MKLNTILGACIVGGAITAFAGELDRNVDYLLLTRENMPTPAAMIEACLNNLDFDPESYESYMKKKRAAAWLPLFHVGGEVQQDRINRYDYVDNYQVDYNTAGAVNNNQTFGGYQQTGYDDSTYLDMWLQWDLRNIVYDYDRHLLIIAAANQENERHFLYSEVCKRYGKLYSLLPDKTGTKVSAGKAYRIIESASVLDAMSGFLISDALRPTVMMTDEEPVVVPNGEDIRDVLKDDEKAQPAVLEVDDGEDDNVEKAF
jgi:hypothetical protein